VLIDLDAQERKPVAVLADLFGLTPREAQVASGLVTGADLRDVAEGAGLTYESARTHLKSVLSKTDTHRQGELVALLNRIISER